MFFASSRPVTDLRDVQTSLCKGISKLNTCWQPVSQACPLRNITKVTDKVIELHNIVCDIDANDQTNKIISQWAKTFRDFPVYGPKCQCALQLCAFADVSTLNRFYPYVQKLLWSLTTSLNRMLEMFQQTVSSPKASINNFIKMLQVLAYIQDLFGAFNSQFVIGGDTMDIDVLIGHVTGLFVQIVQVFLVELGFVDYDPNRPSWRDDLGILQC